MNPKRPPGHADEPPTPTQKPAMSSKPAKRPRMPWTNMRMLGHIQFLKVSYVVLTGVPLLALIQHELLQKWPDLPDLPLIFRLTYFSSLLLSCAHMVFQGYCPAIIKRFESPNDLYRDLLQIKALQAECLPHDDAFQFDIAHCRDNFDSANVRFWLARLLCSVFYIAGILFFGAVLTIQALRVLKVFI